MNIRVAIVTEDPFFSFMSQAILGRDRTTRIHSLVSSLTQVIHSDITSTCDVLICDLDSILTDHVSVNQFIHFAQEYAEKIRIMCLVQTHLDNLDVNLFELPIRALIAKRDLGYYCLHIAAHILVEEDDSILISDKVKLRLPYGSHLQRNCITMQPEQPFPELSDAVMRVVYWRVFLGLDNPDIADELALSDRTVRDYMSIAYRTLGVKSELEIFDILSQWFRTSRFNH